MNRILRMTNRWTMSTTVTLLLLLCAVSAETKVHTSKPPARHLEKVILFTSFGAFILGILMLHCYLKQQQQKSEEDRRRSIETDDEEDEDEDNESSKKPLNNSCKENNKGSFDVIGRGEELLAGSWVILPALGYSNQSPSQREVAGGNGFGYSVGQKESVRVSMRQSVYSDCDGDDDDRQRLV